MFKMGGPVRRSAKSFLSAYARYRPVELDRRFAALDEITRRASTDLYATADLTRFEYKVFSQNGEDGVLVEIFNRIGATNRYFIEFGIQNGTEGNSVLLADVFGWSGLFIEPDEQCFHLLERKYADTPVTTRRGFVTAETVDRIFAEAGAPAEPDLLSIDIDGNDLYVWDALSDFRPRVVVVEYNGGIEAEGPVAQPHDPDRAYDGKGAFGASLAALEVVAQRKGYRLVHTDLTGTNAFFVREELVGALAVERTPRRTQNFGLTGIRNAPAEPPGGWVPVS